MGVCKEFNKNAEGKPSAFFIVGGSVAQQLLFVCIGQLMERSDKSPFAKGGFRGNVDIWITKKGQPTTVLFSVIPLGLEAQSAAQARKDTI